MYMGERDYDHAIQSFFQVGFGGGVHEQGGANRQQIARFSRLCVCVCLILVRLGSNG